MTRWRATTALAASFGVLAFGVWPFVECHIGGHTCYQADVAHALLAGFGVMTFTFAAWLRR